jgi:hypothetical protein
VKQGIKIEEAVISLLRENELDCNFLKALMREINSILGRNESELFEDRMEKVFSSKSNNRDQLNNSVLVDP